MLLEACAITGTIVLFICLFVSHSYIFFYRKYFGSYWGRVIWCHRSLWNINRARQKWRHNGSFWPSDIQIKLTGASGYNDSTQPWFRFCPTATHETLCHYKGLDHCQNDFMLHISDQWRLCYRKYFLTSRNVSYLKILHHGWYNNVELVRMFRRLYQTKSNFEMKKNLCCVWDRGVFLLGLIGSILCVLIKVTVSSSWSHLRNICPNKWLGPF